jgi:hypothetical protein
MTTYVKRFLSGSVNGRPIQINSTAATAGTIIHTAITGTGVHDEVYMWGVNTATDSRTITITFGGTATADKIPYVIPAQDGLHQLMPGIPINNALVIRMFATTSEEVNVVGYVNRTVS